MVVKQWLLNAFDVVRESFAKKTYIIYLPNPSSDVKKKTSGYVPMFFEYHTFFVTKLFCLRSMVVSTSGGRFLGTRADVFWPFERWLFA